MLDRLKKEISKKVIGYDTYVEKIFASIIANGHVLLIGVPGLAKTLLANTIAQVLDLEFKRIQFTPDLMPTDITGTEIVVEKDGEKIFKFVEGPIFANFILADEINRAPAKVQSALLEAMQEKSVTVGNKTYNLPEPFFVIATQNPLEQEGTYPLPEAQLDRFMISLVLDYLDEEKEVEILKNITKPKKENLEKVASKKEILNMQKEAEKIPVADSIFELAVKLTRNTRPTTTSIPEVKNVVRWGAGTRAVEHLIRYAKALAFIKGDLTVEPEHIKDSFADVMRHRIALSFEAVSKNITVESIIEEILNV